jgi:hypothetical protein
MAIEYNGLTLPEMPEGEIEFRVGMITTSDFPYRVAVNAGEVGEAYQYVLIATKSPIYYLPEEFDGEEIFGQMEGGYFVVQCIFRFDDPIGQVLPLPVDASLDSPFASVNSSTQVNTEMFKTIFWANYDVPKITSVNEETWEFETEVWFANSETPSLPPYLCESSDWYKEMSLYSRIAFGDTMVDVDNYEPIFELFSGVTPERLEEIVLEGTAPYSFNSLLAGTIKAIRIPKSITNLFPSALVGCDTLKYLDLGEIAEIKKTTLQNLNALTTLIMRSPSVVKVNGISGSTTYDKPLYGTNMESNGYIYVPSALVAEYEANSQYLWNKYAGRYRAIEDYPDICGTEV